MVVTTKQERKATANSSLAKGGLACFEKKIVQNSAFVLCMHYFAKPLLLTKPQNIIRYAFGDTSFLLLSSCSEFIEMCRSTKLTNRI